MNNSNNDKNRNTVLILVGPKGSGKTYIGSLLSETKIRSNFLVHFVNVEAIFLKLKAKTRERDKGQMIDS